MNKSGCFKVRLRIFFDIRVSLHNFLNLKKLLLFCMWKFPFEVVQVNGGSKTHGFEIINHEFIRFFG